MFRQSSNNRANGPPDHESALPLLRSRSRSPDNPDTVITAQDDDFEPNSVLNKDTDSRRGGLTVRFEDSVQVIAPPLRSTYASRETGMYVSPHNSRPMYHYSALTFVSSRV